jgi:hypothetical protein
MGGQIEFSLLLVYMRMKFWFVLSFTNISTLPHFEQKPVCEARTLISGCTVVRRCGYGVTYYCCTPLRDSFECCVASV